MSEGLSRLKSGNFNSMSFASQDDGSMLITLIERDEKKVYKFKVKDLYGENEEVLKEEVINK